MITKQFAAGSILQGQRVRFQTTLGGKEYYWMIDPEDNWYLAKVGKYGEPVII